MILFDRKTYCIFGVLQFVSGRIRIYLSGQTNSQLPEVGLYLSADAMGLDTYLHENLSHGPWIRGLTASYSRALFMPRFLATIRD